MRCTISQIYFDKVFYVFWAVLLHITKYKQQYVFVVLVMLTVC